MLSGAQHRSRFSGAVYDAPACGDVPGSVDVGAGSKIARWAGEFLPTPDAPLSACGAVTRRICGVDQNHGNTSASGLVFDHQPQAVERPAVVQAALRTSELPVRPLA